MNKGNTSLLKMMESAGKDPLSHDEWIARWKTLYNEFEDTSDSRGFSEIEHAALGALSNVKVSDTHAHLNNELCRMLDTFKHPALLVSSSGLVAAQNIKVEETFDINIGDSVSRLPFSLICAESLDDVVKEVTKPGFPGGNALFKQARSQDSTHELTLAITPSNSGGNTEALVFIISSQFSKSAAVLVKNHYGLTNAECEVLVSFVEGYSLKEIATDRERSHATIRTQFNTLMTKMGAHSQASLLRTALSLSDFTNEIDKFSAVLEHPYRRQADIMREGGRIIDVSFCGDPSGMPLLHLASVSDNRFNAEVERFLFEAGLYVITVCPPAHGKTDPPAKGDSREKTGVEDINAVLDMLNIQNCPVMVSNAGTYRAFHLAMSLPERISRIILLAACPPGKYWSRYGTGASWVDAVLRVGEKYPGIRKAIIAAGLKAWAVAGSKQFYRLQLAGNKSDIEIQMRPENVREIEYALESATTFGISSMLEDITAIFGDYTEKISKSKCPVSIIHGVKDSVLPVKGMRDLKSDFPHRIELFELDDAGFSVFISDTSEVVNLLHRMATETQLAQTKAQLFAIKTQAIVKTTDQN